MLSTLDLADDQDAPVITDYDAMEDQIMIVVPAGATGAVTVTEDPENAGQALVSYDGEVIATVAGGFPSLTADAVVIEEAPDVVLPGTEAAA